MITIIHGEDIVSSRKYFLEEKQKSAHPVACDGEKITATDVMQVFEGGGLFSDDKRIFIEKLFSQKASDKNFKEIVTYVTKHKAIGEVFLWEDKELTKSQLRIFPASTVKSFALPQEVFAFLDALKPNQGTHLIQLFHRILARREEKFVLYMILRQIRLLLSAVGKFPQELEEVKRLAPWQKSKLESQARAFSEVRLIKLYKKLYDIDYRQKTGNSSLSLIQAIDFFLLEL